MDSLFLKVSVTILALFIVEIFLSGFGIVALESGSFRSLVEHFAFSFDHYVEIAFFHLFSIGTVLFIVLHLFSVFRIQNNLLPKTLLAYGLLFGSHIFWYMIASEALKIFSAISLFVLIFYLLFVILKRVYLQTRFD